MDENKRLLASKDGKKFTNKKRRQLKNKVPARASRLKKKGKRLKK